MTSIKKVLKLLLMIIVSLIAEIPLCYGVFSLGSIAVNNLKGIAESIVYCLILVVFSLVYSIAVFGMIFPKLTVNDFKSIKFAILILCAVYSIIGVIQMCLVGFNGSGILCVLLNSMLTPAVLMMSDFNAGFVWWISFIVLFIIGCLVKPLCYYVGAKRIGS